LSFAVALRQRSRGGRRFNLSGQILAQLDAFDSGESSNSTTGTPYPHMPKKKVSSLQGDSDKIEAKRALIRLQLGDVHGAMSILASEDSYLSLCCASGQAPVCSDDRRVLPTPTIDSISCLAVVGDKVLPWISVGIVRFPLIATAVGGNPQHSNVKLFKCPARMHCTVRIREFSSCWRCPTRGSSSFLWSLKPCY